MATIPGLGEIPVYYGSPQRPDIVLYRAAASGDLRVVQFFLNTFKMNPEGEITSSCGISINSDDISQETVGRALLVAVEKEHLNVVVAIRDSIVGPLIDSKGDRAALKEMQYHAATHITPAIFRALLQFTSAGDIPADGEHSLGDSLEYATMKTYAKIVEVIVGSPHCARIPSGNGKILGTDAAYYEDGILYFRHTITSAYDAALTKEFQSRGDCLQQALKVKRIVGTEFGKRFR